MKQILLLTHGLFAEGMIDSIKVIMRDDSQLQSICVKEEDTPETIDSKIQAFLSACAEDTVKLIVTDIPGGSTTTNAIRYVNTKQHVFVITGLNLGMLLELIMMQVEETDIQAQIRTILDNAKATMLFLNDMMPQ